MTALEESKQRSITVHSAAHPLPRGTLIVRGLRLRCPCCGNAPMFRSWFGMHKTCALCGLRFEREPGYFLGSIYFNYGVTAIVVTALYFLGHLKDWFEPTTLLIVTLTIAVLLPISIFPFTRALWSAFDLSWDPPGEAKTDGSIS
ncbi:MAG: DUF983 domain-containing protein [Pirellulales bacterium]